MAFTSWADEYTRAKNAYANRSWDAYFQQSVENSREMRTTFTSLGNISRFLDWLAAKAAEEASGQIEGGLFFSIGGN